MLFTDVIRTKRDGGELSDEQIQFFVDGLADAVEVLAVDEHAVGLHGLEHAQGRQLDVPEDVVHLGSVQLAVEEPEEAEGHVGVGSGQGEGELDEPVSLLALDEGVADQRDRVAVLQLQRLLRDGGSAGFSTISAGRPSAP